MTVRIINADVMDGLAQLADESVDCVVTSPPYWGLRSYLPADHASKESEIGLEPTLQEHIAKLVDVFREVRRVLRKDGTLWLNYGDAYCQTDKWGGGSNGNAGKQTVSDDGSVPSWAVRAKKPKQQGIKPKDLMLMPERLAIALCDDGWWIRSRIIWVKPNPMPESVTDRPTKSHEHIFLLTKSPRYFYDAEAIRERATYGEPNSPQSIKSPHGQGYTRRATPTGWDTGEGAHGSFHKAGRRTMTDDRARPPASRPHKGLEAADDAPLTRNARDVWTIATTPFTEAHFATFPAELAERCILAGCPKGGVVLDPFGGAGTTGLVADRLQRNAVLIELNPEYAAMIERRLTKDAPLLAEVVR